MNIVLPTGTLQKWLYPAFAKVGIDLQEPDERGYCGKWLSFSFFLRDRRMIPSLVEAGSFFHAGITGLDILTNSDIMLYRVLHKFEGCDSKWVLACRDISSLQNPFRLGCELTQLPSRLHRRGILEREFATVKIEGKEEWADEEGLCDAVYVVSQSGRTLKQAGQAIIDGFEFCSYPVLFAVKPTLEEEKESLLDQFVEKFYREK